jgi:hypothetical protein
VSDGLADAPQWVMSLKTDLENRGFEVCEERRFNRPFGLYAVLLQRERGLAIQIASDRGSSGPPTWRIDLIPVSNRAEYPVRPALRSWTPSAVRSWLKANAPHIQDDGTDDPAWLIEHLDLVYGFLAVR